MPESLQNLHHWRSFKRGGTNIQKEWFRLSCSFPGIEGQRRWTLKSLVVELSSYLYLNLSVSLDHCNQRAMFKWSAVHQGAVLNEVSLHCCVLSGSVTTVTVWSGLAWIKACPFQPEPGQTLIYPQSVNPIAFLHKSFASKYCVNLQVFPTAQTSLCPRVNRHFGAFHLGCA